MSTPHRVDSPTSIVPESSSDSPPPPAHPDRSKSAPAPLDSPDTQDTPDAFNYDGGERHDYNGQEQKTVPLPASPRSSRQPRNALGIELPSPPRDSTITQSSAHASSSSSVPFPAPALRRSSSHLSTGSSGSASGSGGKEKKRLRFTPIINSSDGVPRRGARDGYVSDGTSSASDDEYHSVEEGRSHRGAGIRSVPKDQAYLKSDPGTPNLSETADQIRRTLSLASLDSLLVLSANQKGERDKLLAEVGRAGKELVWRDAKEKRLYPKDIERTLVLAIKRGLRSFILAFSVRAGVNVLLLLFRTFRRKGLSIRRLLHAIVGAEPFRFAAMIGTFTFLNTLTIHILRLAPPLSYLRRKVRAGVFNPTTFGPPEREGAEGERRWQAAVAGAVGSLGLLWETKARRRGVAQQMFVRGLQGSYNLYTPRYGIHVPHGDVLLFGLCCGQIMYAWLMSPETIPREYSNWILNASRVPEYAVQGNRTATRRGTIEPLQIQRALQHKLITPSNRKALEGFLEKIKEGWRPPNAIPCEMVHPWVDSCTETNFRRFFAVFRLMLPVYSALHLIPALVLRRHNFQRAPLRMLAKVVWGIVRSCSFLGGFVVIYQSLFCLRSQTLLQGWNSEWIRALLRRKETFWGVGFMTCASLFLEEKRRRAELAMYVLPRALESAWSSARKRAYVPIVPFGETILGAAAMAMVMDAYKHQPGALSGVVRRLMYQLVGPV